MPKVWIIQKPKHGDNYDMEALEALGEVAYMLPTAPNIHDAERIKSDTLHMAKIISESDGGDIFISLGGSPFSQMCFGAAFVASGVGNINMGLYSRGRDLDGRRGAERGSYRIVPMDMYVELPEEQQDLSPQRIWVGGEDFIVPR